MPKCGNQIGDLHLKYRSENNNSWKGRVTFWGTILESVENKGWVEIRLANQNKKVWLR